MTYCVAIKLNEGLVCLSDTRTNAGLDNISKFRKMFTWQVPGERVVVLMTSGNLAITQAVTSQLQEALDYPKEGIETIFTAPTMFRVAEVIGTVMRNVTLEYGPAISAAGSSAESSIVLAGQREGGDLRLFLIYSAGNFIEATDDTPFFQIGEHKYGKPILDRVIEPATPLEDGITAVLLSMDSTLRSNLSVGMPLDLAVIRRDAFTFDQHRRIEQDDPSFHDLSVAWSAALRRAFTEMREISAPQQGDDAPAHPTEPGLELLPGGAPGSDRDPPEEGDFQLAAGDPAPGYPGAG
ncbi:proteasome-type protease [Paralimibaculum aggregatum]|uniref:Proteasome-type protease n=1 Tax=Paralimibaculum aggregatum TaxID=3036245 RepID=A0ABQ6LU59_9RHOB|nr:proteasome-type protease [Limibaculum sp. NKW23]